MALDTTHLAYWREEQRARRSARAALPARWRNDERPEMELVAETYVESMVSMRRREREASPSADDCSR
jgi:hypothetical protein